MIEACCLKQCRVCAAAGCRLIRAIADQEDSNAVDLYARFFGSGTWSTAQLSVARRQLAATTVGSVAIFAGGVFGGNCSFAFCRGCVEVIVRGYCLFEACCL